MKIKVRLETTIYIEQEYTVAEAMKTYGTIDKDKIAERETELFDWVEIFDNPDGHKNDAIIVEVVE